MNKTTLFILVALTITSATFVVSFSNHAQAKISFCASGDTLYRDNVFQCFVKENDCKAFAENNPGTTCI